MLIAVLVNNAYGIDSGIGPIGLGAQNGYTGKNEEHYEPILFTDLRANAPS